MATTMAVEAERLPTGFLAAHNGFVTIHNPATGRHRTFKVAAVRRGALAGKRIVSLLTGPDREPGGSWHGFGFVGDDGFVRVFSKMRGEGPWKTYGLMLGRPAPWLAKGAVYYFERRCRRCNRVLTTPESVERGIGPECAGKE